MARIGATYNSQTRLASYDRTHIPVKSGAREQYAAHLYADADVGRPLVPSLFLYSFVDAACRFPYTTM